MKFRIRIFKEFDYSLKDLYQALLITASFILLCFYFDEIFAYLTKGAKKWNECNCQTIDLQYLFNKDHSKIHELILDAIELTNDLLCIIVLLSILSSILIKRLHHNKKNNRWDIFSSGEGVFVLCHLRQPRE